MDKRGTCQSTGKIIYETSRDAKLAIAGVRTHRHGQRHERSAYNCKFCGKWHITCMGERVAYKRPTRMQPHNRRWKVPDEEE